LKITYLFGVNYPFGALTSFCWFGLATGRWSRESNLWKVFRFWYNAKL